MAAVYVTNLVINSGADFSQSFTLEGTDSNSALNLTGYDVNAQFRKWSGSSTSVSFGTTITSPPTSGQIYLTLSAQDTLPLKAGRYVYDIVVSDNYGVKTRVVEGMVLVREGVTR
jgi:hypothetical protein